MFPGLEAGLFRRPISPDGTVHVGLLLPLSGVHAAIGRSMLQAAQMAMFEIADEKFALLPVDTKGTPEGAAEAAGKAIVAGAQIILGPLLAESVRAVAPITQTAGIQFISFSNSVEVAGDGAFVMGFLPHQQVEAIVDFAVTRGYSRYAALTPDDRYGQAVVDALDRVTFQRGVTLVRHMSYPPGVSDFTAEVRSLADYDRRHRELLQQRASLEKQTDEASRQALRRLARLDTAGGPDFDAILLPTTGQTVRAQAAALAYYDANAPLVRVLGLRNWDEMPNPGTEPSLNGAWYAAPAPKERQAFIERYKATFGNEPARLASLAYDATALAALLAQYRQEPHFTFEALTDPNGFEGLDGLFRFRPDGVVERTFAILEVRRDGVRVIQDQPRTFRPITD